MVFFKFLPKGGLYWRRDFLVPCSICVQAYRPCWGLSKSFHGSLMAVDTLEGVVNLHQYQGKRCLATHSQMADKGPLLPLQYLAWRVLPMCDVQLS